MQSHWRVFTDTRTTEKALKLIAILQKRLEREPIDVQVEPYHKGGHVVSFNLSHDHPGWNDIVVDAFTCAQSIGHEWQLGAFIQEEINLVSTQTSVGGIKMIHCCCVRIDSANSD